MQDGRRPPLPYPPCRGERRVVGLRQVDAVRVEIGDTRPRGADSTDPAGRRAHTDSEPVVLAHKQQRERKPFMRAVRGGIERTGRRGVVDRRVPKTAYHEGVIRPWPWHAELGSAPDGEGQPYGSWQV